MEMHKYWGFGLKILSEIEFPELLPYDFDTADVGIRFGIIPLIDIQVSYPGNVFSYHLNDTELVFDAPGVAEYYAANGKMINLRLDNRIDPKDISAMRSVRLYLLATVFAAILLQRKQLPLHASAIIKNGKLVLIAGDSGAGKSTILAEFMKQGYEVFRTTWLWLMPRIP
jgi:ABC-type multidrug transport system fused ATPase/permease subunit